MSREWDEARRLRNEVFRATPVRDDTRDAHFALEELRKHINKQRRNPGHQQVQGEAPWGWLAIIVALPVFGIAIPWLIVQALA